MKTILVEIQTGLVEAVSEGVASYNGLNRAYAVYDVPGDAEVRRGDALADIAGAVAVTDASRVKYRAE
jgi:hypothetical protein